MTRSLKLPPQFSPIFKVTGAGNNFLFVEQTDLRKVMKSAGTSGLPQLAKTLCNANFSVGADGLAVLRKKKKFEYDWRFFNADGTRAEMCGNAARCVGYWAIKTGKIPTKKPVAIKLSTDAGIVPIQIDPRKKKNGIAVQFERPSAKHVSINLPKTLIPLPLRKHVRSLSHILMGVPHWVVEVSDMKVAHRFKKEIATLRASKRFAKNGSNVTIIKIKPQEIEAVTFERGVEGYTLACGTGALAAAESFLQSRGLGKKSVQILMPGGQLVVRQENQNLFLSGPTQLIGVILLYPA